MTASQEFVAKVEAFLARTKMPPTQFGRLAVGDPSFVGDIRGGRAPSLRLVERVDAFIAQHDAAESAA